MRMQARLQTVLAGAVVALAVTACGGSRPPDPDLAGRSPAAIVAAATRAIDGVSSVQVTGAMAGPTSVGLDLRLVRGRGAVGSMTVGGQSLRLIAAGSTLYVNAGPGFWARYGDRAAVAALQGRWLRSPLGSGQLASLASLTDARRLVATLLADHGALTRAGTTTVDGRQVVELLDRSRGAMLYVAATGPAYPIRVVNPSRDGGRLDFGDYGAPVSLAPPGDSVALQSITR